MYKSKDEKTEEERQAYNESQKMAMRRKRRSDGGDGTLPKRKGTKDYIIYNKKTYLLY